MIRTIKCPRCCGKGRIVREVHAREFAERVPGLAHLLARHLDVQAYVCERFGLEPEYLWGPYKNAALFKARCLYTLLMRKPLDGMVPSYPSLAACAGKRGHSSFVNYQHHNDAHHGWLDEYLPKARAA